MGPNSARNEPTPPGLEEGASIGFPLPVTDDSLFKHSATPYILNFLCDHPDIDVSIRQLARLLPVGRRSTRNAVDALINNGLLEVRRQTVGKRVGINRRRLQKPEDPILNIPQTEFQTPVRVAREALLSELSDVKGIILFGSVATGTADRKSDIDLWVLVGEDPLAKRTAVNELAKDLGSVRIPDTFGLPKDENVEDGWTWSEIKDRIEEKAALTSVGTRYSFEIIVESPQSILNQLDRVDTEDLFGNGITLYSTETLDHVVEEVLNDE